MRKISFAGIELTSQRVRRFYEVTYELPGRPARYENQGVCWEAAAMKPALLFEGFFHLVLRKSAPSPSSYKSSSPSSLPPRSLLVGELWTYQTGRRESAGQSLYTFHLLDATAPIRSLCDDPPARTAFPKFFSHNL